MSVDRLLELLADRRRRHVLRTLADEPGETMTIRELRQSLCRDSDLSERQLQQELHHRHLPALSEVGLITVDDDVVRYRSDHRAERLLATIDAIT
ncbi:DUF7344 domain-containing protein [Halorarius litoreus]|uniref:DUF7344 domain-containing protein n=1 Tax=Halorarius litoreus TaxID=2962676 RepID=UPI0020CC2AC3|nr:hypothetical protein [Halorarius litoreus]